MTDAATGGAAPAGQPAARSLLALVLRTLVLVCVLTPLWWLVAPWTSAPVGWLAARTVAWGAPAWVESATHTAGSVQAVTRIAVPTPQRGRVADLVLDADPARYAYSLPMLVALLLAVHRAGWWRRAVLGTILLLPFQCFSTVFALLVQVLPIAAQAVPGRYAAAWQLEAIAFAYQLGVLVVPTLSPLLVWAWLERSALAPYFALGSPPPRAEA